MVIHTRIEDKKAFTYYWAKVHCNFKVFFCYYDSTWGLITTLRSIKLSHLLNKNSVYNNSSRFCVGVCVQFRIGIFCDKNHYFSSFLYGLCHRSIYFVVITTTVKCIWYENKLKYVKKKLKWQYIIEPEHTYNAGRSFVNL